jgi:hypothetical protein
MKPGVADRWRGAEFRLCGLDEPHGKAGLTASVATSSGNETGQQLSLAVRWRIEPCCGDDEKWHDAIQTPGRHSVAVSAVGIGSLADKRILVPVTIEDP